MKIRINLEVCNKLFNHISKIHFFNSQLSKDLFENTLGRVKIAFCKFSLKNL